MKKLKAILELPAAVWLMIITHLPGKTGNFLRYRYWKKRLGALGERTIIDVGVYFQNPRYIEIGGNCWIDRNVMILAGPDRTAREKIVRKNENYPGRPGAVRIDGNVHVAANCLISGISAGVYISEDCGIATGTKIFAFTNHYRSVKNPSDKNFNFAIMVDHEKQCIIEGPVFIGRNSGVAVNSVILPGVTICENSFVTINSVVIGGEFPENSLIAGNPAKVTGRRFDTYVNEQNR